jgi:hypothetical protein
MGKRLSEWVLAIDGTSLPEKSLIGGKAWSIAGGEALDFDDHSGNVRSLAQTIGPGNIVKGRIFSNDDSLVRIAIERGAASIVTSPVLPALRPHTQPRRWGSLNGRK